MSINLLSINANGLNHPAKRSSLWKTTLSGGYNILCVQETHFVLDNAPQCKHKNFPHVFKADYICKQRGVLIAVRDTLAFSLLQSYIDPGGRYDILVCTLDDINYTIVNVYAPNARQMQFHKKVLKKKYENCRMVTFWFAVTSIYSQMWISILDQVPRDLPHHYQFFFRRTICMTYGDVIMRQREILRSTLPDTIHIPE